MQHGLTYFDANYTYANNVADTPGDAPSSFAGEVNYGGPIADRFNIKRISWGRLKVPAVTECF